MLYGFCLIKFAAMENLARLLESHHFNIFNSVLLPIFQRINFLLQNTYMLHS